MELNHTIVPSHDKANAAKWIGEILGLKVEPPMGHFCPVRVDEHLTLDFDDASEVAYHHYAFKVTDGEFDAIYGRVLAAGIAYGSQPGSQDNREINQRRGGRGFYFRCADGHSWEVLTR